MSKSKFHKQLENFRIRSSGVVSIVGGSFGLGKGDQDHLKTCNEKREKFKIKTKELEQAYQSLKNTPPVYPDEIESVPPLPEGTEDQKIIKSHERAVTARNKKVESRNKKIAAIDTRKEKAVSKALERLNKHKESDILTEKQDEREKEIIIKKSDPMNLLPEGLKTCGEKWLMDKIYMRKRIQTSKQTEKGLWLEDAAIELLEEKNGYGFAEKNEIWFEDDFKHGTPDLIFDGFLEDVKNVYTHDTFPMFKHHLDPRYFWQGVSYCDLVRNKMKLDIREYKVTYVLMSMTEEMLKDVTHQAMKNYDNRDKSFDEVYEEMVELYVYDGLPDFMRVKTFVFPFDPQPVEHIHKRVLLTRDYINKVLLPQVPQKVIDELSLYSANYLKAS